MKWQVPEQFDEYKVSENGDVYSLLKSRLLQPYTLSTGYLMLGLKSKAGYKRVLVHRLVAECFLTKTGVTIDHIDGNITNNHFSNLRWCTRSQNAFNAKNKSGVSRFKGVTRCGTRWRSYITVDGKQTHLGCFATEEEAGKAYNEYAVKVMGDFAKLNEL